MSLVKVLRTAWHLPSGMTSTLWVCFVPRPGVLEFGEPVSLPSPCLHQTVYFPFDRILLGASSRSSPSLLFMCVTLTKLLPLLGP
jgi:hypothetical protein